MDTSLDSASRRVEEPIFEALTEELAQATAEETAKRGRERILFGFVDLCSEPISSIQLDVPLV